MMYLDADIQVFDNIDHLFDMADGYFYAVLDCFCEKTWSHSPQYSVGYCQQCPDRVKWPVESMGSPPPLYFNAGMFVFEPSRLTYESLLETLRITPPTPFAEQVSFSSIQYTPYKHRNLSKNYSFMVIIKLRNVADNCSMLLEHSHVVL